MINSLHLSSYKSFVSQRVELSNLTLLTGLNNSGKSSIIQSIRMFERAYKRESPLLPGHGFVNEIHSNLARKNSPIKIRLFYEGSETPEKMILREHEVTRPKKSPRLFYISASRLGPQVSLPLSQQLDSYPEIGEQGEFVLDLIEKMNDTIIPDALIHRKSQGKTFEFVLSSWLTEIAPGINFKSVVTRKADSAYAEIDNFRPTNVGFGISYALPIIATTLAAVAKPPVTGWANSWGDDWSSTIERNGSLLLIENPEAHLHPSGQTMMGKMVALAASCGAQIIVESHSDHFMDGIRIAVKENLISNSDVKIHYLSKDSNGVSVLQSPKISIDGRIDNWPEGFFDQSLVNRAFLARKD